MSRPDTPSAADVIALADGIGVTLATAESCTGGLLSASLTAVPGASAVYLGGVVAYSNDAKCHLLGVDPALVDVVGAVSDAVAMAMAAGVRDQLCAELGVAITGVAGPDGGTADTPVGTVWLAVSTDESTAPEAHRFPGGRDEVRTRAAEAALALMHRTLSRM